MSKKHNNSDPADLFAEDRRNQLLAAFWVPEQTPSGERWHSPCGQWTLLTEGAALDVAEREAKPKEGA